MTTIYIIPTTKKVFTTKELKTLFVTMTENGVEFLDKFELPYKGTQINQRVDELTYRYKSFNQKGHTDFIVERIKF